MAKSKAKTSEAELKPVDKLAELMKDTSPEQLQDAIKKTERIALRMTRTDKAKLDILAKECGLTATEYITRLNDFAWEKLKGK